MKKHSMSRACISLGMTALLLMGGLRWSEGSSTAPALWKRDGAYLYSFQQYTLVQWNEGFQTQLKRCLAFATEVKSFSANKDHFFWINEADEGFIHTFDTQELVPFGPYGDTPFFWESPMDMVLAHELVWVLDKARATLEGFSLEGEHQHTIALDLDREYHQLFYHEEQWYLVDTLRQEIQILNLEGELLHTLGGKGSSRGLFQSIANLWVDMSGNIYVYDDQAGKLTCFSSLTLIPWQIALDTSSFAVADQHLLVQLSPEARLATFELPVPALQVWPEQLDFGKVPIGKVVTRSLIIASTGTTPLEGKLFLQSSMLGLSSDTFIPPWSMIEVHLRLSEAQAGQDYANFITLQAPDMPLLTIPVHAQGMPASYPSLSVEGYQGQASSSMLLPFTMEGNLEDYTFTFNNLPGKPVTISPVQKEGASYLQVSSTHRLTPGAYSVQLEVSPKAKQAENSPYPLKATFPLLLQAQEHYLPHEPLMEGFVSVWCLRSGVTQEGILKLKELLHPLPLNYIRYYIMTQFDSELSADEETNKRAHYYINIPGTPTHFYNGQYLKYFSTFGSRNNKEIALRMKNLHAMELNAPATLGFDAHLSWNIKEGGLLNVRLVHHEELNTETLSLNAVLLKKHIEFQAISGQNDHYDVFQKFLTPIDESYYGIPLQGESKDKTFEISFNLPRPDPKLYEIILFVQCQETREVFQSLKIVLNRAL